jgi:hypothetical protein
MPQPSRFTEPVKKGILEYLRLGASRQTAAHANGIGKATLTRWVQEGETAARGSAKRKFYEAVIQAEAEGNVKALRIVRAEMENDPKLAWKYLERREPGYAPPQPHAPSTPEGPMVIQLSLSDGGRPALPEPVIEGDVVDDDADGS